jgi:2-dehydro-3-deoxyphosphooctonate aldolase (KDO 8-P synthase)
MRIIAGPCQHESLEQSLEIAQECKRVCDLYGMDYYFKASYDKANRTSVDGKRGLGLFDTLYHFTAMKESIDDLQILTDVHTVEEVHEAADFDVVDVIQIPAFLCRQTDLIRAAASRFNIVNVKKGQFLAPWDVEGILSKLEDYDVETWITERGTSFGYNTLVVDFTGMDYLLNNDRFALVFDATHSVQRPGGNGSSSGGNRNYVPGLTRAASALGVSNFFLEVHPDPDNAPSDGANMLKIEDFEKVVHDIFIHRAR